MKKMHLNLLMLVLLNLSLVITPSSSEETANQQNSDTEANPLKDLLLSHPDINNKKQELTLEFESLKKEISKLEEDLKKPTDKPDKYEERLSALSQKQKIFFQKINLFKGYLKNIYEALNLQTTLKLPFEQIQLSHLLDKIEHLKKYQNYVSKAALRQNIQKEEEAFRKNIQREEEAFRKNIQKASAKQPETPNDFLNDQRIRMNQATEKLLQNEQQNAIIKEIEDLLGNPLLDNSLYTFASNIQRNKAVIDYISLVKRFYDKYQNLFQGLPKKISYKDTQYSIAAWHLVHVFLGSLEQEKFKGLHYYGQENQDLFCRLEDAKMCALAPSSSRQTESSNQKEIGAAAAAAADQCEKIYIEPILFDSSDEYDMQDGFVLYQTKKLVFHEASPEPERPSYFIKRCTFFPKNMSIYDCMEKIKEALSDKPIQNKKSWKTIENFEFEIQNNNVPLKIIMGYNTENGCIETFFPTNGSFKQFEGILTQDQYREFINFVSFLKLNNPKAITYQNLSTELISRGVKNIFVTKTEAQAALSSSSSPIQTKQKEQSKDSEQSDSPTPIHDGGNWKEKLNDFMKTIEDKLEYTLESKTGSGIQTETITVDSDDVEKYINHYFGTNKNKGVGQEGAAAAASSATQEEVARTQAAEEELKINIINKYKQDQKAKRANEARLEDQSTSSGKGTPVRTGAASAASSSNPSPKASKKVTKKSGISDQVGAAAAASSPTPPSLIPSPDLVNTTPVRTGAVSTPSVLESPFSSNTNSVRTDAAPADSSFHQSSVESNSSLNTARSLEGHLSSVVSSPATSPLAKPKAKAPVNRPNNVNRVNNNAASLAATSPIENAVGANSALAKHSEAANDGDDDSTYRYN